MKGVKKYTIKNHSLIWVNVIRVAHKPSNYVEAIVIYLISVNDKIKSRGNPC